MRFVGALTQSDGDAGAKARASFFVFGCASTFGTRTFRLDGFRELEKSQSARPLGAGSRPSVGV